MRITGYRIDSAELVYHAPVIVANTRYEKRNVFYLYLFSGEHSGVGEVSPLAAFGAETVEAALEKAKILCEYLVHYSKSRELQLDEFYSIVSASVETPALQSGLEQAFLQLYANALTGDIKSIYRITHIEELVVNAMVGIENPEKTLQICKNFWEQGYTTIKLKAGKLPLYNELGVLEKVREHLPERLALRLDFNASLTVEEAMLRLKAYENLKIEYIEQPVAQVEYFTALREHTDIPLAVDEGLQNLEQGYKFLEDASIDYYIIKPSQLGMLRDVLPFVHEIESSGKNAIVTHALESGLGRRKAVVCAAACLFKAAHGLSPVYTSGGLADISYPVVEGRIAISSLEL